MRLTYLLLIISFLFSCENKKATQNTEKKPLTPSTSLINDDSLKKKAVELAQRFIIVDGHIDLPHRLVKKMEDISKRTENGHFDYVRAKEGGLDAPFMSIYVPASYQKTGGAKQYADKLIDMVIKITTTYPDKFAIANSPTDIQNNVKEGKISLPMGIENGAAIENKLSNIRYFYQRGVRYITLTHSKNNLICDSSYDSLRQWNGLSPFGKEVVEEMNRTGIMIDVAHVSDSTFYQVMRLSNAPVIASHSSCRHFTPNFERNMSDDMIKLLAAKGGVMQINFGSIFLTTESKQGYQAAKKHIASWLKQNKLTENDTKAITYINEYNYTHNFYSDIAVVADHIDHVVKLVGIDYVGFGSDFDGIEALPEGLKDVSQYPNLIYHLLKRNYSEEDIRKIGYANVFRVWNNVEKERRTIRIK